MPQQNTPFDLGDFMARFKSEVRTPADITALFNELSQTSQSDKRLAIDTAERFLISNTVAMLSTMPAREKAELIRDIKIMEARNAEGTAEMLNAYQMLAQTFTLVSAEKGAQAEPFTKAYTAELAKFSAKDHQSPSAHVLSLLKAIEATKPPSSKPSKGPKI